MCWVDVKYYVKRAEMIKVKLFGTLRLRFKPWEQEFPLDGPVKLKEFLAHLEGVYPGLLSQLLEGDALKTGVIILLNGKNVHHLAGLETEVRPGDTLVIFPPGAGG